MVAETDAIAAENRFAATKFVSNLFTIYSHLRPSSSRNAKVPTIALTQSNSPVARAADITVPVDLQEGNNIYRPTSTRIAYLALVDIIASLVAYRVQPQATVTLRRLDF